VVSDDYQVRWAARRALHDVCADRGVAMVTTRPAAGIGGELREPDALPALPVALQLLGEVRGLMNGLARRARQDGHDWDRIGEAFGFQAGSDPEDTPAARAFTAVATPGYHSHVPEFTWKCPGCDQLITDHGPGLPPNDNERGHAAGCARFAATLQAWDRAWDTD
jgi:hypothetical protein